MSIFSKYILIGMCCTMFTDIVISSVKKHPLVEEAKEEWGMQGRLLVTLLWPLAVLIFLKAFFTTIFKK